MSLRLCRSEQVKNPYYVGFLGIHVYSVQEMAYVIYHYPLLVMDRLVDERLLDFLREELNLGFLVLKLENWKKSGEDPDEMLVLLLQESDYYSQGEIAEYKQTLAAYRKQKPEEMKKLCADAVFGMRQYGKAARLYREILEESGETQADRMFTARVWNNLGACYGRMFLFDKAYDAFEKAYNRSGSRECLRSLYWIEKLDSRIVLGERFRAAVTEAEKADWDAAFLGAQEQAGQSELVKQVEDWFREGTADGEKAAAELIETWKSEYRAMV